MFIFFLGIHSYIRLKRQTGSGPAEDYKVRGRKGRSSDYCELSATTAEYNISRFMCAERTLKANWNTNYRSHKIVCMLVKLKSPENSNTKRFIMHSFVLSDGLLYVAQVYGQTSSNSLTAPSAKTQTVELCDPQKKIIMYLLFSFANQTSGKAWKNIPRWGQKCRPTPSRSCG